MFNRNCSGTTTRQGHSIQVISTYIQKNDNAQVSRMSLPCFPRTCLTGLFQSKFLRTFTIRHCETYIYKLIVRNLVHMKNTKVWRRLSKGNSLFINDNVSHRLSTLVFFPLLLFKGSHWMYYVRRQKTFFSIRDKRYFPTIL